MEITREIILFAMVKLLTAGNKFAHDCPEEILWELNNLMDDFNKCEWSGEPQDTKEIFEEIEELNKLYQ